MVSITLSVPEELKKEMDIFNEINWSAVAREAIKNKIVMLRKFKEFTRESTFTEEETLKLGKDLNKNLSKHYRK